MRHLDLFSGIGGFALAARWMNWETVQFVELDKFCQKVLQKNFPNVPIHDDIKTFDGTKFRGAIDIVTGGFPCQSFSLAGKGAVDLTLWKEMFRIVAEVRPSIVVAENVYGILARKKGMALSTVYDDLESEGYTTMPPFIIPACATGAPHRRDRVWIVALADRSRSAHGKSGKTRSTQGTDQGEENKRQRLWTVPERTSTTWLATDSECNGPQRRSEERNGEFSQSEIKARSKITRDVCDYWQDFPTQPPLRAGNDGLRSNMVRSAIKGAGNAVVPNVVYEIFKAIEQVR